MVSERLKSSASSVDLSVIIPVYNAEKYLKQCLTSITNQTYLNIEIICVYDNSSDCSLQILEEYAKKDSRITIIKNKTNSGPGGGASRNIGIKRASGKYIAFVDADDFYLHENCLSKLIETAIQNDLDLLIFGNKEFDEELSCYVPDDLKCFKSPYLAAESNHLWNSNEIDAHRLNTSPFPWNKIYSKEMLIKNDIYFPEKLVYDDMTFSNCVSLFCKRVLMLNEDFYCYRINVPTSTTKNIAAQFDSIIGIHASLLYFLKRKNIYSIYKIRFALLCVSSLCLYFLPQIKIFAQATKLNEQISSFIKTLELSRDDLKKLKQNSRSSFDIISKYENYKDNGVIEDGEIKFCKIPIIKYKNYLAQRKFYLFSFIPIYKIVQTRANRTVHYLFDIIPYLKIKNGTAYLFMLIPFLKIERYRFFTSK